MFQELHELVLTNHQELIIAKMGKEAAEETNNTLQSDIKILKDQISNQLHEKKDMEETLLSNMKVLRQVFISIVYLKM